MKKIISLILLISILCGLGVNVSAYSGAGTVSNPYVITTPEDLMNMKNDLSAHYVLGNNIDMSGVWYEPIGNDIDGAFTGSFDGKGYTISNLDLDLEGSKYVGLFGYLDGTVKNVNLENVLALGYRYVGGIAGRAGDNSYISDCIVSGKIDGIFVTGTMFVGGIAGTSGGEINNCTNNSSELTTGDYVGGIVGSTIGTVNNCINNCNLTTKGNFTGGIAGQTPSEIINCVNNGDLCGSGDYLGGIVGYTQSNANVKNCINNGELNILGGYSPDYLGGIIGYSGGLIFNCINNGNIYDFQGYAGGITSVNNKQIGFCVNNGNISVENKSSHSIYIGGIFAENHGYIENSINVGTLYASSNYGSIYAGGIGANDNSGKIENCMNSGNISAITGYYNGSYSNTYGHIYIGGIAGQTYDTLIKNCNTFNRISAQNTSASYACFGGIIGRIQDSSNTKLSDCLHGGELLYNGTAYTNSCVISGSNYSYYTKLSNVYYLYGISPFKNPTYDHWSYTSSWKGITIPYSDSSQQEIYGFDFDNYWYINKNINSGLPQLQNMPRHMVLSESILFVEKSDSEKLGAYIDDVLVSSTWSSDNESIASVSTSGTVTGVDLGSCTITATDSEGMKANCLVIVYDKAENIEFGQEEYTVSINGTVTPTVTQSPNESVEMLYWASDNTDVATVGKYTGLVAGKKSGVANITATTILGGVSATCKVIVTGNPVTALSLSKTSANINKDDNLQMALTVTPADYDGQISWSSSDENIATVDSTGLITAKYPGIANIYAQAESGVTTQCTVTVKAPATEIKLNKSELTLQKGYTEKLLPAMTPEYTTDSISWASSNSSYVSVSTDGTVTAKAVGQVIITATTTSGQKAYCTVNVVNPSVSVSSVTLDKTELIMTKADMAQLKASVLPTNATNQNLTWVSSDESVATVNSTGVVTAVDTGVAIISATANNGVYHECVIKVISASGSSVVLSDAKASPDGTVQVKASLVKNPGISGYKFTVKYDESMLTPVNVTNNSDFGGSITTNLEDSNRNGLNIVWHSNEDIDINGELFTINFKVSDTAEYGDSSSVSLEYGAKDICNTAGEYFALYIDDATISIEEPLPGDVYEDGEVTVYDLTTLARYITSLEEFTGRQIESADVNNDGLINILDVIRVGQYLVGWSGVELMSLDLYDEPAVPVVSVGSASVNSANEAEIPVYIKNNSGILGYRFVLDYNAEDIEILSITPSDLIDKDAFYTNLGAETQLDDGLKVTCFTTGNNITDDGVMFTVKVRYKNHTDTSVSPIRIKDNFDNMGNQDAAYVTANYETGYALGSDYIVANKVVGDTNFSCELYFDDSYAEKSAKAIIAFYDGDGRMVQLQPSDITVKPGKVDLSIDYDKKAYATYKLMIWEGMGNLKPITEVK